MPSPRPLAAPLSTSAAAVVALALVAGCGGDDDDAAGSSTAAPASTPAEVATTLATSSDTAAGTGAPAGDSFPVTIEHAYGTTEIPAEPVRVVTVGYNDQDPVLTVGVVPVGVMPWYEDQPIGFSWTVEAYGDALPSRSAASSSRSTSRRWRHCAPT